MDGYEAMEREMPAEVFICDDSMIADMKPPYPELTHGEREAIRESFDRIMEDSGL